MSEELVPWQKAITSAEKHFNEIAKAEGNVVLYKKEALFAWQAVKKSEWLQKCDPHSLQDAVINVASIGLTLNPANGYAYIVPRNNVACLDISYKGLIKLASDSGNIQWAKAVLVYEVDHFEMLGIEKMPVHEFDPFREDRGKVIGGYCAAKLKDESYLIDTMSIRELDQVQATSKAQNGPWKTWPDEMRKKTLIKRASKTWPNTSRLDKAVEIINEHEGLTDEIIEGTSRQVSTEAVDASKVLSISEQLKDLIDQDQIEDTHQDVKDIFKELTNDERTRVQNMLKEKAPDSRKMYSTLLKDHLDYRHES